MYVALPMQTNSYFSDPNVFAEVPGEQTHHCANFTHYKLLLKNSSKMTSSNDNWSAHSYIMIFALMLSFRYSQHLTYTRIQARLLFSPHFHSAQPLLGILSSYSF